MQKLEKSMQKGLNIAPLDPDQGTERMKNRKTLGIEAAGRTRANEPPAASRQIGKCGMENSDKKEEKAKTTWETPPHHSEKRPHKIVSKEHNENKATNCSDVRKRHV
jgi:hypothetical protein